MYESFLKENLPDDVREVFEALIDERRTKDAIILIGIILNKEFLIPNKDLVCVK